MSDRTSYVDIILFLMENYQGLEVPNNQDLADIFECSSPTVKRAKDYLKENRYLINGVLEVALVRKVDA